MTSIALIQTSCGENSDKNRDNTLSFIGDAVKEGAQIICLQELFNTTYFCREIDRKYFEWAETIPGPTITQFKKIALEHNVVLTVPIFEKQAPGIYYNSMVVIDADGSIAGTYRKMHIPDDPGFFEKYYFTPGDLGYKVFETKYGKIGTLICWDQWFPEAARITAMMGADILVYPTAIGTLPDETDTEKAEFLHAWQTIQKSHAIANGCFVAGINRVGIEGGTKFWGHSFVAGPFGKVIAEAGEKEQILMAECDFSEIEQQRQTWPFFRDRRIDSYKPIEKRFL
ncbi:MAG: carbon-nitrogen hydrolase [Balneolaceae bacterium]